MRHAGIDFEEVVLRFTDPAFKQRTLGVSPSGRVPVLEDAGFVVWDTLAIAEYLAERFPDRQLWPADARARARARSLCAEMHSGLPGLRNHFPMNLELSAPELGPRVLAQQPLAQADLARVDAMWREQLAHSRGPLLFGAFSLADAFFAPVAARIRSYGLPVSAPCRDYIERIFELPAMQAWVRDALAEHDFVADDEPYRSAAAR
jgi:glutathione S-transferase